ncbi:hypothetical protein D7316_02242 [Gordonia insulae]|uniref:Uncharacterized protein n=1 Tax=Gordonia insulae TaxID=2420509 RepID=A0A3G8JKV1_9ACTN|nr:hypothetical protein D7316_02242 [Gordonia insulae]
MCPADPIGEPGPSAPFDMAAVGRFAARHLLPVPAEDLDTDDAASMDDRECPTAYIDPSGIRVDIGPSAIVFHESGAAVEETVFAALNEVGGIAVDPAQALAVSCDDTWLESELSPVDTLVVVATITEMRSAMRTGPDRSGIVDGRQ